MTNLPCVPNPQQPNRFDKWAWIHDRLTWPVASSALFALIAFGYDQLPIQFDGCDEQARTVVEAGEAALLRGEVRNADLIAAQALDLAPSCRCGHLLAGKVKHSQMQAALKTGAAKRAQVVKQECFSHSIRAGKSEPEVAALRKACSTVYKSNI